MATPLMFEDDMEPRELRENEVLSCLYLHFIFNRSQYMAVNENFSFAVRYSAKYATQRGWLVLDAEQTLRWSPSGSEAYSLTPQGRRAVNEYLGLS